MSKLTITNLDELNLKTDFKTNTTGFILIFSFLVLVFILGILLLNSIEDKVRLDTGGELEHILNSTAESMNLLIEQKENDASILASEPKIPELIEPLISIRHEQKELLKSKPLEQVRLFFTERLKQKNDLGMFIVTPDSINIASMRDEDIGLKNFLFSERGKYINNAFSGMVTLIPALDSDIPLLDASGTLASGFTTMFVAAPIRNSKKIIAVLLVRINLTDDFSRITKSGQYGDTGETYAIDTHGRLLSRSRYEQVLRKAGLMTRGTVNLSTFEIRNPGVNISEDLKPVTARYLQDFTFMADKLMKHESGSDLNGYTGYTGEKVLGAWRWIDRLGIGLATEIHEEEALELYSRIKLLTFIGLGITVVFALSLVFGMLWVKRKSYNALVEINEKLEENVKERTKQLAKVNEDLVDSWERFRKLTHHSHDLNIIISITGEIKFESSAAEKILGTKEGERLGKTFIDYIHEADLNNVKNTIVGIIDNPEIIGNVEYRYKRSDDNYVVLESFIQNFVDDPNIEGIIINSRDVTDRRLAEELVKKSEQRFRSVWENSRDGMCITDADGMILMVNQMFCNMVKKDEDEMIGELFSVIYKAELQQDFIDKYYNSFENGDILGRNIEELTLWDNSKLWFSFSNSFIYLDDGSKVVLSIIRDITQTKKAELINQMIFNINNTVFESESLGELLKNVHKVLASTINAENFFLGIYNEGQETISIPYMVDKNGIVKEIPLEKTFTGYVLKKGEPVFLKEKDSLKMIESGEVDLIGKLSKVWLGIPIKVNDALKGVIVFQDYEDENSLGNYEIEVMKYVSEQVGLVMERILAREALLISENRLRETNQTKDKFFSIIAHDLRNPFVTILGFSDILNEDYSQMDDEERLNLIREMRVTAQSTYGMLENLLNWSRSETGTLKISPRLFSIGKLVDSVLSVVDGNAKMKEIELKCEIDRGIKVFADKSTIETVIRNLVTNAIKFSNSGGYVEVKAEDKNNFVEISIEDNGVGMSREIIDKLFDLSDTTTTRGTANEGGSGLGLVLCKEFVEKNKGEIRVESIKDKGSTFIFTLPKM